MATSAATSVGTNILSSLANIAANLLTEELTLLWGLEDDVQSLRNTFSIIGAYFEDAEKKQLEDHAVEVWLRQLKEVAYDAEDVLDEFATEAALRRRGRVSTYSFSTPLTWVRPVSFRHGIAHRVVGIRERFKQMAEDRRSLGLQSSGGAATQSDAIWRSRETTSLLDEEPIGRKNEKEKIIDILLSSSGGPAPSSSSNAGGGGVSLIPIVGMAGMGKTTIAKAVFNDPKVEEHFPVIRKWLFVGRNFDARALLEKITGSPVDQEGKRIPNPTLEDFHMALKEKLKNVRFLIVLDDVWSERQEEWEQLWKPLTHQGNEGKVLVTTRNQNISRLVVNNVSKLEYFLGFLSDDDCQKIFEKHAFGSANNVGQSNLKEIGRRIVQKLKGVPLAAKAIGGFLYNAPEETWIRTERQSEMWSLTKNEKYDILTILRLSYQYLVTPLKQCFAFCSVFPKGYVFGKTELVNIWMANGFIQPQGDRLMEDIGSAYLDELTSRSFFQYTYDGVYKMHDLMHDLAKSISKDECLTVDKTSPNVDWGNVRHLSHFGDISDLKGLKKIRTFLGGESTVNAEFFNQISCIRVLDLRGTYIIESPKCIGALKHLRYLDVRRFDGKLPESLCNLHNLQTLKASDDCELPKGMNKLINLRHLEARPEQVSKIAGIWKLTSLQELKAFRVNKTNRNKIEELGRMAHLRQLSLWNLENVESIDEVGQVGMKDKLNLDELELVWSEESTNQGGTGIVEAVLEGLQPRQGLRSLGIKNYRGSRQPSWMQSQNLSCIVSINLCNCSQWKTLPNLAQFRSLKNLTVKGMVEVEKVGEEFYGDWTSNPFPKLENLVFGDMPKWKVWVGSSEKGRMFPSLLKLETKRCPVLTELPALPPTLLELTMDRVGLHRLPVFLYHSLRFLRNLPPGQRRFGTYPSLRSLFISGCNNLTTLSPLSQENLNRLQTLHIYGCEELVSFFELGRILDFSQPTIPLAGLVIFGCSKLSLEEGLFATLTSLSWLDTDNRSLIASCLLNNRLVSLESLTIRSCGELASFTEEEEEAWGRNLASLGNLTFDGCQNLRSLPKKLTSLSSLEGLAIIGCPQVVRLPEEGLPISLRRLWIKGCPELRKSCKGWRAPDRHKIAHIPDAHIE